MNAIPVVHVLYHSPWYFRDSSRPMDTPSMTDDWHVRTATALHQAFPAGSPWNAGGPTGKSPVKRVYP